MKYPTMEEVKQADRLTICRWFRFLPSPGISSWETARAHGNLNLFHKAMEEEKEILERICERHNELGGFSPEISKALGGE